MPKANHGSDQVTRYTRWIARGLGSLMAALWLFIGIASAIGGGDPWTMESAVITIFIITAPLSVLLVWLREGVGGALLVIYGVAFSTFGYLSAGHNRAFATLITGLPFLLAGTLFLTIRLRARGSGVPQNGA